MAGLSPEKIKALLAVPDRKKRTSKSSVDPNDRTYQTWFKLHPRAFGGDSENTDLSVRPQCSNPNCLDERPRKITAMGEDVTTQFTIVLPDSGIRMCRRCFLDGYGLTDSEQATLV